MYAYIDSFRKFGKTNTDNQSIKIKRPYPEGKGLLGATGCFAVSEAIPCLGPLKKGHLGAIGPCAVSEAIPCLGPLRKGLLGATGPSMVSEAVSCLGPLDGSTKCVGIGKGLSHRSVMRLFLQLCQTQACSSLLKIGHSPRFHPRWRDKMPDKLRPAGGFLPKC